MIGHVWITLIIIMVKKSQALSRCQRPEQPLPAYLHEGEIIIGGLIPVHEKTAKPTLKYTEKPPGRTCEKFYFEKYQYVLAMLFAISEINANPLLMANLTLGFEIYDSCYSDAAAVDGVMGYLSGKRSKVPNYRCAPTPPKLSAVVGDSPSSGSIAIARILGLTKFPQLIFLSFADQLRLSPPDIGR
ncbi:extracellular calcium-sensing receptor-like [Rana temporaria]|uniref:extracellular calcium-sensing receptor-like n=1 Tax=Rana temporaria TaxID=8407 RepID=UPI001AAE0E87|nr:extracellular calcium-sensing receptor-like [Rana temporaria]